MDDALLLMIKTGCLATDNQSVSSLATSQYLHTVSSVGSGIFLQMMPPHQFVQALRSKVLCVGCSFLHTLLLPLPHF